MIVLTVPTSTPPVFHRVADRESADRFGEMNAVEHIVMAAGASQPHGKNGCGNGEADDEQPLEEIVFVSFHGLVFLAFIAPSARGP